MPHQDLGGGCGGSGDSAAESGVDGSTGSLRITEPARHGCDALDAAIDRLGHRVGGVAPPRSRCRPAACGSYAPRVEEEVGQFAHRGRGQAGTTKATALMASMRKLLITLTTMLVYRTPWHEHPLTP